MAELDPRVRTILEETRFLTGLQGSVLFAFNALVPLYPLGRQVIVRGGPPGEAGRFTAAQIEALIVVVGLGVVAVFLPLYVRLLIRALEALRGGEGSDQGHEGEWAGMVASVHHLPAHNHPSVDHLLIHASGRSGGGKGCPLSRQGGLPVQVDWLLAVILVLAFVLILLPLFLSPTAPSGKG